MNIDQNVSSGLLLNLAQYIIVVLVAIAAFFTTKQLDSIDDSLAELREQQVKLRIRQASIEQNAYVSRQIAEATLKSYQNSQREQN